MSNNQTTNTSRSLGSTGGGGGEGVAGRENAKQARRNRHILGSARQTRVRVELAQTAPHDTTPSRTHRQTDLLDGRVEVDEVALDALLRGVDVESLQQRRLAAARHAHYNTNNRFFLLRLLLHLLGWLVPVVVGSICSGREVPIFCVVGLKICRSEHDVPRCLLMVLYRRSFGVTPSIVGEGKAIPILLLFVTVVGSVLESCLPNARRVSNMRKSAHRFTTFTTASHVAVTYF